MFSVKECECCQGTEVYYLPVHLELIANCACVIIFISRDDNDYQVVELSESELDEEYQDLRLQDF